MSRYSIFVIAFFSFFSCNKCYQSFTPGQLWFDNNGVHINAHGGGILEFNGAYYWFGEHKIEGDAGNKAQIGVHCYSSTDLYNWKDEGIALSVVDDSTSLIVKGCIIERPKVIYNASTNKFVMWFHHELKGKGYSAAMTGLAIGDKVTGPYRYVKSVNPNAGVWPQNYNPQTADTSIVNPYKRKDPQWREYVEGGVYLRRDFNKGQMARDMTLFVDDDGTAYHIHSSENNQTLHVAQLTDDYLDFSGKYSRVLSGESNEAPAIFKRKGQYYMISSGCTGWSPNPARSAVAPHPLGPWKALGNPCKGSEEQVSTTFHSQSTYVLPVPGKEDAFIYMGDRWMPENAIDGSYVWLPIEFEDDQPVMNWQDEWSY
ncbi:glycoside hydrolase family 43 protein [Draconibacterium orientale]|uniref:glycoside hydrolase family 43 protein n=1 Tax=Draconibacterium orientale TaxID=1168034 RepID=UPI002ABE82A5|nr:glycoside hydrolase family 43 protein [Draconibacterium orientale]